MAGAVIAGVGARAKGAASAVRQMFASATSRAWWVAPAAVGIVVVVVVASAIAIPAVLLGTPPAPEVHLYNVTFEIVSEAGPSKAGSLPFGDSIVLPFDVDGTYLLGVTVDAAYTDQSTSPITDPTVSLVIDPPDGMPGTWIIFIPPEGWRAPILTSNTVPPNQTVEATSPEEALKITINGTLNETLGIGQWTGNLDCGSALGGPLRPSGSITYSVDLTYFWIEPHTEVLP